MNATVELSSIVDDVNEYGYGGNYTIYSHDVESVDCLKLYQLLIFRNKCKSKNQDLSKVKANELLDLMFNKLDAEILEDEIKKHL